MSDDLQGLWFSHSQLDFIQWGSLEGEGLSGQGEKHIIWTFPLVESI